MSILAARPRILHGASETWVLSSTWRAAVDPRVGPSFSPAQMPSSEEVECTVGVFLY
jgi:hypothetical protein